MRQRNIIREIKERLAELEATFQTIGVVNDYDEAKREEIEADRIDAERSRLIPLTATDINAVLAELDERNDIVSARAALIIRTLYERLQGEEIEETLRRR